MLSFASTPACLSTRFSAFLGSATCPDFAVSLGQTHCPVAPVWRAFKISTALAGSAIASSPPFLLHVAGTVQTPSSRCRSSHRMACNAPRRAPVISATAMKSGQSSPLRSSSTFNTVASSSLLRRRVRRFGSGRDTSAAGLSCLRPAALRIAPRNTTSFPAVLTLPFFIAADFAASMSLASISKAAFVGSSWPQSSR